MANEVANALSHKTWCSLAFLVTNEWKMMCMLGEFGLECVEVDSGATLYMIKVQPALISHMIEAQQVDDQSDAYHVRLNSNHGLDY